jgi:hypothetical protein
MIRSLARRGARKDKSPPVAQKNIKLAEPSVCEKCGAVYARRTWRQDRRVTEALLNTAAWTVCPACRQATRGEYYGRVLIRGSYALTNEAAIRERIRKVEERARFTQPERKLVSVERDGDVLEVLTTSQKLAHRIAKELKKAFHGRATYSWSDRDGSLFATWERD